MNYKIHGSTIFIKGNGIVGQYKVHGNKVLKMVEHHSGDLIVENFHILGQLALNSEAELLNNLRIKRLI
jgi:hypothetical protein